MLRIFKKILIRLVQGICGLALFIGLQQLIEIKTRGFCLQKIFANDLPFNPAWQTPNLSEEEQLKVSRLLDQPYYFLGAGSECFAFLSEDGQTVIKFFKLNFDRPFYIHRGLLIEDHTESAGTLSTVYAALPHLPQPLHHMAKRFLGMREFRIGRTMLSLKLAYDNLKEETGLVYLHLNPSYHLKKKLTIYDPNMIGHQVDLDTTRFLLQQRAYPIAKHLLKLRAQGAHTHAQDGIDSFMDMMLSRCKKGFADRDIVNRNFGFINNQSIETDSGSFIPYPLMQHSRLYKQELFFGTLELKGWLIKNYPEILPHFHAKLNEELSRD